MMDAKRRAHEMTEIAAQRRSLDQIVGQLLVIETACRLARESIADMHDRLRALETRTTELDR